MRADACVIGTGAGGAPVAKELAEGGLRVVMLEEGERFTPDDMTARPGEMTTRLYRDAGQTTTIGNVPIMLPLGTGGGRHDGRELGHVLPHAARGSGALEGAPRARGTDPGGARPVLRACRARAERGPGHAGARGPERCGREARRRRSRLAWRLCVSQRQGLCRVGSVRLRLPDRGQAARRAGVRAEGLGRGRCHLQRLPRPAHRAGVGPCPRGRGVDRGGRAPAGRVRPRGRGLRRGAHAAAPAPQRARRGIGRARPQPGDPPRHRRACALRRADRHGPGRAAVVLHRRVR